MKLNSVGAAILFVALLAVSCGKKTGKASEEIMDENVVEISSEQFSNNFMELGVASVQTFSDEVACKGFLFAPADGIAKVSTPVAGAVQNIRFKIGDYVKQGQTICFIGGSEFLSIQQQFAESAAAYQKTKSDFERMKALRSENIGAHKDYVSSESAYKASFASYNALKARIQALRLNPSRIENGQMSASFPVVSPINGYITRSDVVMGQYVEMANELAEVVNVNKLQLQLSVFETDIAKLETGQTVQFGMGGDASEPMQATLITIGKSINPETKSIDCIARIEEPEKSVLVNNSYVEAKVTVNNRQGEALPVTAVQKEGEEYFIFVVENQQDGNYTLRKTKVEIGKSNNNYIEVIEGLPDSNKQIVLKGIETL